MMKDRMNNFFRNRWLIFAFTSSLFIGGGIIAIHHYYKTQRVTEILDFDEERDKPFILDIFKNDWYWLVSEYSTDFSPEYMLHYHASSKNPEHVGNLTIKTLYDNTNPIGFVAYYKKSFYDGFILFLAIRKEYKAKGYGKKLLQYAIDDLKSRFVNKIRLVTRVSNAAAIKLYTKSGFKETSRDGDGFVYFQ